MSKRIYIEGRDNFAWTSLENVYMGISHIGQYDKVDEYDYQHYYSLCMFQNGRDFMTRYHIKIYSTKHQKEGEILQRNMNDLRKVYEKLNFKKHNPDDIECLYELMRI